MKQEQYKKEYQERKERLLAFLDRTIVYLEQKEDDQAETLQQMRNNIEQELFSIVLVGEFSTGKSMFLNAMMHRKLLPSWNGETTATVNFLRHTSKAPAADVKGVVYYRDGERKELHALDGNTIEKLVTTRGDDGEETVAKTIERVDLFLDNRFLKDGVMLVDSPGLNGLAPDLQEITRRQVQESHASIFMFNAMQPGSKTDFDALRELKKLSPRVFIVLNKIDAIKAEEGETPESMIEKLKQDYHRFFPEAKLPEIFPVSARHALVARDPAFSPDDNDLAQGGKSPEDCRRLEEESRMELFEDRLWKYLTQGERTREQLESPLEKANRLLLDEKKQLGEMIKQLDAEPDVKALQQKQAAIQEEIERLKQERQEMMQPVRKAFGLKMRDVEDRLSSGRGDVSAKIGDELQEYENGDDLYAYGKEVEATILPREITRLMSHMEEDLRRSLREVVEEQSALYFDDLDQKLEDAGMEAFHFEPSELKLDGVEGARRMQADKEEIEKIEDEVERLMQEKNNLRKDMLAQRQKEDEIAEKKESIRGLRRRIDDIEKSYVIPPVDRYREEVEEVRDREGIGGKFWQIFAGPKHVKVQKTRTDSSAHDVAEEKAKRLVGHLEQQVKAEEKDIPADGDSLGSEQIGIDLEAVQERLERKRKKLDEARENFSRHLNEDNQKACRNYVRKIRNYVDGQLEEAERMMRRQMTAKKKQYLNAVEGLLETGIRSKLETCEKRLQELMDAAKASDAERNEKLQQAKTQQETVKGLLDEAAELEGEFEQDMQDKEQEE